MRSADQATRQRSPWLVMPARKPAGPARRGLKRGIVLGAGLLLVPLLVRLLMAQGPSAPPPTYTITDIGPQLTAGGMNNSAQVVGVINCCISPTSNHGFLWSNGVITDLGTLNGGLGSEALAINDSGQVVGDTTYCTGCNTPSVAFVWQNSTMTPLGFFNGESCSRATAINNLGAIAGLGACSGNGAFLWGAASGMSAIPPLNPDSSSAGKSRALGINSQEQIVGQTLTPGNGTVPYFWQAAVWNALSGPSVIGPAGFDSTAVAINDAGQIVGFSSFDPTPGHQCQADLPNFGVGMQGSPTYCEAVLWENGTMQNLGQLGAPGNAVALAINSFGNIVGSSLANVPSSQPNEHAFLYLDGSMVDLNYQIPANSGYYLIRAVAINDTGQIVVQAQPVNGGAGHALLLTPVIVSTTTTLAASANPSVFGQQMSFGATVMPNSPSSLTPTGTVTFRDGATVLGTVALSSGTALFNTAALAVSSHAITASYAGDNNFSSSTSSALSQTVSQAGTTTALVASPNPASFGQAVTFTATVTVAAPGAGTPTGAITFLDGTTTLGTGSLNNAGTATFSTASLAAGSHSLTASYSGDVNFTGSATATVATVTVQATPPPVQIMDNETISVTDAVSFSDVGDTETVRVADAVFVTPLVNVGAPVVEYSAGSLGFGNVSAGQTGTQSLTLSDIGQAPLVLSSAAVSQGSAFTISQIACSNGAISLPTTLPVGSVCTLIISYLAPSGAAASDTLTFTDNAALSNVATAQAGSSYTQSIPLSGAGSSTPPPPPPPAVIPLTDNETISVTDTVSFSDVVDTETVHVADAVFVTPLINVGAPVADYSAGSLGFGNVAAGQTSTQSLSVSDIGQAPLMLSSAAVSQGSAFTISHIACSNGATSLPTTLPVGAVCTLMISYLAPSGTPASDTLTLTDNAALSNVPTAQAGSSYTQSIALNGSGTTTPPPPPPPAVIPLTDNETISVTDSVSFSDVVDAEDVHVSDTITLTLLNTPAGTNVTVTPADATTGSTPVTVTYGSVTQPGMTSLTTSTSGAAPPAAFQLGTPPVYYNLSTSATFTGSAVVCINYTGINFTAPPQLFHYNGTAWGNVTTSVDTMNHIICGTVTSFSPFAIFQPTTQPPVITSGSSTTFTAGSPGSFTVTATGLPTPTLTETGTLPSGLSFNASTGVLSGTPATGTGGTYNITFTANNGVGTAAMQSFTLTVNQAPAITSASSTSFTFGTGGTFTVTATGFPAPTLSDTGTLPSGVSFNASTGVLSGTPAQGTVGTYNVTFDASNGVGAAAAQPFTLTVSKANQAITLAGVPSSALFGQGPFILSASATSGLVVTLSANGNCLLSSNSLSLTGVGSCTVSAVQAGNSNYNAAPTLNVSFPVGQAPTTTSVSVSPASVQYSDYTTLTAAVSPFSAGGQSLTGNVQFYLSGSAVGSPAPINSFGVATLSQVQVKLSAGNYPVKAVFTSTNANFAGSSGTTTQNVAQEDAFILYSGDTIAQVGTLLNLRATVWDSAATGYPGMNPETGPNATIGDITKMWIAFDIYAAGTCGSGTPSTLYAQVALTSTAGVGTATSTFSSTSEVSYCVVSRLVAGSTGGANLYYTAPNAEAVGLDFYINSGQFANGGGWVNDPTGSHGNFGFNARYNSTGSPKGQMVYIYRALYNGVLADFIIKSNALTALQFSGTTYPISSTLQGKANVQVNRASDGLSLFSVGNYTFSATVTDSGQNGTTGKQFSLIVYDTSGVPYHSVPAGTSLQGGNVVVHSH